MFDVSRSPKDVETLLRYITLYYIQYSWIIEAAVPIRLQWLSTVGWDTILDG